MLIIGLLSLICSLVSGVFGFGASAPPSWSWEKGLFFLFLIPAVLAFGKTILSRPSPLWDLVDGVHAKRLPQLQQVGGSHVLMDPAGTYVTQESARPIF